MCNNYMVDFILSRVISLTDFILSRVITLTRTLAITHARDI